ncbi:MAG: hypothetical protein CMP28_15160 [Roseibacillus sp.]|nr:hypothetical protein [Roseibacillus sp.]
MSVPEEENIRENDSVWGLVDQTAPPGAGPFFVRNVMREVRLSSEQDLPWWKQLLTPRPVLAGSLAAVAAILIAVNPGETGPVAAEDPAPVPGVETDASPLDVLLEEEILSQAAEDPSAFSDEALVALLNQ